MSQKSLVIIPYESVGDIRFGMSPSQVEEVWGPPESTDKTHLGGRVDFYDNLNIGYTISDEPYVNHVGGGRNAVSTMLSNIKLFEGDEIDVLKKLMQLDNEPKTYLGFIVFLKLGIILTGFHDNDKNQLAFTVFEKGAWDSRLDKLKPFKL